MSKPTTAEFQCYKAFANVLHLQHRLAEVINNQDFENAWPAIENAFDKLTDSTILIEAHHDAKRINENQNNLPNEIFCEMCNAYHFLDRSQCFKKQCPVNKKYGFEPIEPKTVNVNEQPITFCYICNRYLHQIKGGCTSQTCPNPLNTNV
jgi:hypothetical protein